MCQIQEWTLSHSRSIKMCCATKDSLLPAYKALPNIADYNWQSRHIICLSCVRVSYWFVQFWLYIQRAPPVIF